MKAICLIGSPARASRTGVAVGAVAQSLIEHGFDVQTVDLAETRLPHVDLIAYYSEKPHPVAAVREFIATVRAADAIVLGTPVQHAGYSGVLKSAIDLLPADAFADKAVGLVANASGPRGASIACEQLRGVVKALGGWAVPTQVVTTPGDFDDQRPALVASAPIRRCGELACALTTFTSAMRHGAAR